MLNLSISSILTRRVGMLLGDLDLNGGPAIAALTKVNSKFNETTASLTSLGTRVGTAFAGIAAAIGSSAAVLAGFKGAIDLGGELADTTARTGESVQSILAFRDACAAAGLGADSAEGLILKLQNGLGDVNEEGEKTAASFEKLGTSSGELKKMGLQQQIETLTKGFAKLDQASRVQISRNLFGKQGGKFLAVLGDPEAMKAALEATEPLARIYATYGESFGKLDDALGRLGLQFHEFFAGALAPAAPAITELVEAFNKIDFTKIGMGFGDIAEGLAKVAVKSVDVAGKINSVVDKVITFVMGSQAPALVPALRTGDQARADRARGVPDAFGGGPVGGLQRIGRGGGFAVGGSDPLLTETQRQTSLLQQIAEQTRGISQMGSGPLDFPAV